MQPLPEQTCSCLSCVKCFQFMVFMTQLRIDQFNPDAYAGLPEKLKIQRQGYERDLVNILAYKSSLAQVLDETS